MPDAAVEFFAKVQTGFVNNEGTAARTVSLKTCDYDGTNVTGDAFNAQTEVWPSMDTALFTDMVVRYRVMNDGTKVIISPNQWDQPHGTVIWEAIDVDNLRPGWAIANGIAAMNVNFGGGNVPDLSARFIMAHDPTGRADENGLGDTGGFRLHGPDENNHDDHLTHTHEPGGRLDAFDAVDGATDVTNLDDTDFDTGEAWDWNNPSAVGAGGDFKKHFGSFDANQNTDNRPRYYVSAARIRNA